MQFAVLHRAFPASPLVSSDNEGCFPRSKADHLISLYCLGPLTPHDFMVQGLMKHLHTNLPFLFTQHVTVKCFERTNICYTFHFIFQYISNKMQLYTVYLYLETALHVSGVTSTHHQERVQLYLQHLVFVTPLLLPAAIAAGSSNGVTNTRCCIYSCTRS